MTMELNRRTFLSSLIGGVAIIAAERTFPFRVYSFPTNIALVKMMPEDMHTYFRPPMSAGFKAFLDKSRMRDRKLDNRDPFMVLNNGPSMAHLRPGGRSEYIYNPTTKLYHRKGSGDSLGLEKEATLLFPKWRS